MIVYTKVVEDWGLEGGPDFADVPLPGCVLKRDGVWVQSHDDVFLTAAERVALDYHPTGDYSKPALAFPCSQKQWDKFIEHMCDPSIPLESVPETPVHVESSARNQSDLCDVERERGDALALELDELLASTTARGRKITAGRIMKILRSRAGNGDTCILSSTAEGVKWERDNGDEEELSIRALDGRIKRWKEKNTR